ncbi:MAG: glycoside hydrolase family 24 protein [Elusimicrobiales bacterium]
MKRINRALILFMLTALAPAAVSAQAFEELLRAYGGAEVSAPALPAVPEPQGDLKDAEQYLPPDNDNPGYEWASYRNQDHFVYIGGNSTFLKSSPAQAEDMPDGYGRCALSPNTAYKASSKPGFEGDHMIVVLAEPLPGCSLTAGYIYMTHVASSSAGGFWELPRNVKAFLDTLAFAEGTREHYDYIFTFATFTSYADHPRIKKCAGKLCSTAAGRYQFLSRTWDPLAADLGLPDFTPPNQEKATLEIIRRAGAYNNVARSSVYENFTAALSKLNTTWASLPGSPYGQPTHPTSELWRYYKGRLALY